METLLFIVELAVLLLCIIAGAKMGGIGLGVMGGVGMVIFVFFFGEKPHNPPIDVMLIILSVITAAAALQGAGGMEYIVKKSEKLLRSHPSRITFLAPLVTYFLTFCEGTGHCSYAVLPAVAEISREEGIRPERPLSIAVIASQQAVTASPIAAATAALLSCVSGAGVQLWQIIACSFPATFIGCLVAAFIQNKIGCELEDDPIYQDRLKKGLVEPSSHSEDVDDYKPTPCAKWSVIIFLIFFLLVLFIGLIDPLRPAFPDADGNMKLLSMVPAVQMLMLFCAAIIVIMMIKLKGKDSIESITKGSVWQAGTSAVVSIFGVAWMGETFFDANKEFLTNGIEGIVTQAPWLFAVALFVLSIFLFSQAVTVQTLMPLGVSLGIPAAFLVGMFPSVNGYFFFPNYPTVVAAINFDTTGTTRIGKYILNHSFMLPGLVSTILAVGIGIGLASVIIGF